MVQWLVTGALAFMGLVALLVLTPPQYLIYVMGAAGFGGALGISVLLGLCLRQKDRAYDPHTHGEGYRE